jgi:hypothetical protein
MISRSEIYAAIDKRLTHDKHAAVFAALLPIESPPAEHKSFIGGYLEGALVLDQNEVDRLTTLLDIAAIAIRCLEHHGLPQRRTSRLFDVIDEET